jgi:hypothetical protein
VFLDKDRTMDHVQKHNICTFPFYFDVFTKSLDTTITAEVSEIGERPLCPMFRMPALLRPSRICDKLHEISSLIVTSDLMNSVLSTINNVIT